MIKFAGIIINDLNTHMVSVTIFCLILNNKMTGSSIV